MFCTILAKIKYIKVQACPSASIALNAAYVFFVYDNCSFLSINKHFKEVPSHHQPCDTQNEST